MAGSNVHPSSFRIRPAPKYLSCLQIIILLLSIACIILVIFEIQFQKRWEKPRWFEGPDDAQIALAAMPLIKLNNVLRLTAYTGLFVTAIFYLTKKVMFMYTAAVVLNIAVMIILLISEMSISE